MHNLITWPANPPHLMTEVMRLVTDELGEVTLRPIAAPEEAAGHPGASVVVLVDALLDAHDGSHDQALAELRVLVDRAGATAVLIVGDGFLGTDAADVRLALLGGGAIALMRSVAVRREGGGRINVVCVPEGMFGTSGTQRAPLRTPTDASDVAAAIGLLLGDEGGYLNGQTLFVNGGRHLFSSMSA